MSALAWGEFLCGPLEDSERAIARWVVRSHVPIATDEATVAARLFNLTGRRRNSFSDCLIAATAIMSGAELATANAAHFERSVDTGLELAE